MKTATITHDITCYPGESVPMHHWAHIEGDVVVSELWVDTDTHEIMQVETDPTRQGQGLASALYHAAAAEMDIYHAPEAHRTHEGDCFARSVGGDSLPCQHGCCETEEY